MKDQLRADPFDGYIPFVYYRKSNLLPAAIVIGYVIFFFIRSFRVEVIFFFVKQKRIAVRQGQTASTKAAEQLFLSFIKSLMCKFICPSPLLQNEIVAIAK
ncbi:MAG: hypothetical protein IKM00_04455 [Clostridia bacterium]|nr:hypothetical protein [Clostridia bacterium]